MSTIKVDNLQTTGGAGLYPAKAWVNFNGSGTVAIRASGNVSSITDNGVGDFTINLTDPVADGNYTLLGTGTRAGAANDGAASIVMESYQSAFDGAAIRIRNVVVNTGAYTAADVSRVYAAVLR